MALPIPTTLDDWKAEARRQWYERNGAKATARGDWINALELEEEFERECEANLIRLMKVRRYLWT